MSNTNDNMTVAGNTEEAEKRLKLSHNVQILDELNEEFLSHIEDVAEKIKTRINKKLAILKNDSDSNSEKIEWRKNACKKMINTNNRIVSNSAVFFDKFKALTDDNNGDFKEFEEKVTELINLSTKMLNGMRFFKKVPETFDLGEKKETSLEAIHEV